MSRHLTTHGPRSARRAGVALAAGALVLGLVAPALATSGAAAQDRGSPPTKLVKAPTTPFDAKTLARLGRAKLAKPTGTVSTTDVTLPAGSPVDPIDLRVLVLATTGDPNPDGVHVVPTTNTWDDNLSTLTNALDYTGVPYDTYKSSTQQLCMGGSWKIQWAVDASSSTCTTGQVVAWTGGVTASRLWDGAAHAYYQGVMQTNGTLLYLVGDAVAGTGTWSNGLTSAEWTTLWAFEAQFGIRTVSAYTYPSADFGLSYVDEGSKVTSLKWTNAGAAAFPYVNGSGRITVNAGASYAYRARALSDGLTTVILKDQSGYAAGVIHTVANQGNRQVLALTLNSAGFLLQGEVLGYGLVNWVTKGLFLGQRKALLDPQTDDIFIADSVWQPTTVCGTIVDDPSLPEYRITGADLTAYINWQKRVKNQALTGAFTTSFPFNGEGTEAGYTYPLADTLTPVARSNQGKFKWINHTYDHANLDTVTYAEALAEIQQNNTVANTLRLGTFSRKNLVQPDISGLTNPAFLQAAYDTGVRYLISDTSRTGDPALYGVNEGRYNTFLPGILEIARYPVNLYFNVATPQQWLAEDNCIYKATALYGHVSTYAQLLDRESDNLLRYLLLGHNRPLMFHQTNLTAYDGTHSLLGDLIDATLTKYRAVVKMQVTSPTMNQIGLLQAERMAYNDALRNGGLTASIVPGVSITLTSQKAVTVPVTGLASTTYPSDTYGGQRITQVPLAAGQTLTLPLA
jgi:hypothetical protein